MPEIAIFADTWGPSFCRSCGAPVEWAETISGKRIPFEGTITATRTQDDMVTGRVIAYVDTAVSPTHFERCPHANTWRKRNRPH